MTQNNIDIDILAQQIRIMSVRTKLYRVLKRELSARGWWKNRARGKQQGGIMNGKM